MRPEPPVEVLSAYVDQELTGLGRQKLEEHLRDCETCRRRLDAMRQTVQAIQALPTEAPPRTFTIPAQREQVRRWGPIGAWASGLAAVAMVGLIVTIALRGPHPAATSSSGPAALSIASSHQQKGAAAPYAPAQGAEAGTADQALTSRVPLTMVNQTVVDPRDPATTLMLATQPQVAANGSLVIEAQVHGAAASTATIQLSLVRNGYAVVLNSVSPTANLTVSETVPLSQVALPNPRSGSYQLMAVWKLPSGDELVVTLPVQLR